MVFPRVTYEAPAGTLSVGLILLRGDPCSVYLRGLEGRAGVLLGALDELRGVPQGVSEREGDSHLQAVIEGYEGEREGFLEDIAHHDPSHHSESLNDHARDVRLAFLDVVAAVKARTSPSRPATITVEDVVQLAGLALTHEVNQTADHGDGDEDANKFHWLVLLFCFAEEVGHFVQPAQGVSLLVTDH